MDECRRANPVIAIDNLTFTYPGALKPSLKNLTLNVEKGEFLAVAGNNGSGKSTLCKVINALIPQFAAGDMEGKATVCGMDTAHCDIGELAKMVGFVYQDFENQIICPTVLEDASFACLNYAVPNHLERGMAALKTVGLERRENEYVWQLSGGEKHLLALAGVIALDPDVYILDEPTAQLDFVHAKHIYDILRGLNENHGKTVIAVEHHTEFIAEYCNRMVLMDCGSVLWKYPAKEALRRTDELLLKNISPPQITRAASILRNEGKLPVDRVLPTTLEEGRKAFSSLRICRDVKATDAVVEKSGPCVRFIDIKAGYSTIKEKPRGVFDGMTLDLFRSRKTALAGSNGSGKSTLLKLLTGILRPASGDILVDDRSVLDASVETISQKVSLVFQNPEEMFIMDCIKDDIAYALKSRSANDYEHRLDELLSLFDLEDICHKDGRLLSGGQMRRASIAIGVAAKPQILLLDEPTSNLDTASRNKILHALGRLESIVETVIVATHDIHLVCEWAERIVVLSGGVPVFDGELNAIFSDVGRMEQAGLAPPSVYRMAKELDPFSNCFTVDDFVRLFGKGYAGAE